MKRFISITIITISFCVSTFAQNTGIGTPNPQAKLDVNGTFRLQDGVTVNEISTDTTFLQASDEILPTQLALKKYLQHGQWVPGYQLSDSTLILRDSIANQQTLIWVDVQGNYAYALRALSGLFIYDITNPDSIQLRGSTTTNMNSPQRICVQGDYAYVTSSGNNKLNIYNISNPDNIVALGTTSQNLSGPWGLYVEGDYAYVTSFDNDRLCIFNISNPNSIIAVSYITHANMDGPEMVWKNGNYVWVTSQYGSGTGYLHRFDVSNISSPVVKGFSNQNLNRPHDVQTVGNHAFVTSQFNNSLVVFDGSDPSSITQVAALSSGLFHPNHISINGQYAYVTSIDQASDIRQINIDDPLQPVLRPQLLDGYSNPNAAVCAKGQYLYLAGASNHALWVFELKPLEDDRRVTIGSDGELSYNLGVWQVGHQLNSSMDISYKYYDFDAIAKEGQRTVYRMDGNIGIGTSSPQSKLHLVGDQKFYGGHNQYLEFGAGIVGKETEAGKISYQISAEPTCFYCQPIYYDVLRIVGGGAPGHRRTKLWADEVSMSGQFATHDTMRLLSDAFYTEAFMQQQVGLHMEPDTTSYSFTCATEYWLLHKKFKNFLNMRGVINILDNGEESGLYMNPNDSISEQSYHIGMKDAAIFGVRLPEGDWPFQINTVDGHIGIFSAPDPVHRLMVGNKISTWADLKVNGITTTHQPDGTTILNSIETGIGVANKHPQSGLLRRNAQFEFEITGAGPDTLSRRIKFWAEGGLEMPGDFKVEGTVSATSIATPTWEDLSAFFQNGWVDYGGGYVEAAYYKDPSGVVHLRGLITGGLNQQNTVICTLPTTHRPTYGHLMFAVVNGVDTLGRIDIESDGDVVFRGSTNTFVSLDQIQFRTF